MSYTGEKGQLSLTSWPIKDNLPHPIPYTSVEVWALALALAILCADVTTSNSADGIIVAFVLGSIPPFRNILVQMACLKCESNKMNPE